MSCVLNLLIAHFEFARGTHAPTNSICKFYNDGARVWRLKAALQFLHKDK